MLIAWYRQRLKVKIQNIIISIKDLKDIKELIKQVIKIDNKIYQSKKARRELGKLLQVYKSQVLRQVQQL